jgi:hypothetical protein
MPDPSTLGNTVWHNILLADEAESVPDLIHNTTDLVKSMLDQSVQWAKDAIADSHTAVQALKDAKGPEHLPDPPKEPVIQTSFTATAGFAPDVPPNLGAITQQNPAEFAAAAIVVPDVSAEIAPYVPLISGLTIPEPPVYSPIAIPTAPGVNTDITVPDAPTIDYGRAPALIDLTLPAYIAPVLPVFTDDAPEFTDVPPDPAIQWKEPVYASGVKDAVAQVIQSMLAGGTGLPADVERAIWERARQREDAGALKTIEQAAAQWTSRGYDHPPGQLNGQALAVLEETQRKGNELSREVAIKQAELEQENRKFAVTAGVSYEQVFVGLFIQVADRNFQIAKFAVESQMTLFNARVAAFNVRQAVFAQRTERVRVQLQIALANLEEFRAQLEAEKAKGIVNEQRQKQYDQVLQQIGHQIEIYKTVVSTAQVRAELEKNKVEVFKAQVDGASAQVNQQRAAFEAYSARIAGESAKANLEEAFARSYAARVQAIAVKADVALKAVDAKIQNNRLNLEWQVANLNRLNTFTGHQLAAIQAAATVYNASTSRATAKFEADKSLRAVELQATMEAGRIAIARYQASLEAWRTRSQEILSVYTVNAESMRAIGQIQSTLAAGAMAGTHVSAGVSGSASAGQSKSDSTSKGSSFTQSVADANSYGVSHVFNHEV